MVQALWNYVPSTICRSVWKSIWINLISCYIFKVMSEAESMKGRKGLFHKKVVLGPKTYRFKYFSKLAQKNTNSDCTRSMEMMQ